jgi:hypothetical protein
MARIKIKMKEGKEVTESECYARHEGRRVESRE